MVVFFFLLFFFLFVFCFFCCCCFLFFLVLTVFNWCIACYHTVVLVIIGKLNLVGLITSYFEKNSVVAT